MEDFEFELEFELEPYYRKNLYARNFYLDICCYPMCCGCPYFNLGCDIVCSYDECEILRQIEVSLNMGY